MRIILAISNAILFPSVAADPAANLVPASQPSAQIPGVVIDHSPAISSLYIGSPSIAILTNGDYVASHDFFGPKSKEFERATAVVFRSTDRGNTWKKVSEIHGAFWSSLFVHRGALYLLGPNRHHGDIYVRRSTDRGETWTEPTNTHTGVLRDNGQYHCAPMPVVEHNHRLWRAFERRNPPEGWGTSYCAGMLSIPVDADLLDAANWTSSNFLPNEGSWNEGDMGGWLEGNAVIIRDGRMLDILRVDTRRCPEKAAIVSISPDGKAASFDSANGFINFPGGAKKFTIRYDPKSDLYWSLATIVPERHQKSGHPASIRNTLALTCAKDLTNWTVRCILLYHPDTVKHGFQYADWQFDGDDLIAAVRTAFDDGAGGAHSNHDANFLTFHRVRNFRRLTLADSARCCNLKNLEELQLPSHPDNHILPMGTATEIYRYISRRPGIRGVNAFIEGTRIGVHDVIGLLQNGESVESIIPSCFPGLTKAQVYECLAYYEDHRGEIDLLVARQMAPPGP